LLVKALLVLPKSVWVFGFVSSNK